MGSIWVALLVRCEVHGLGVFEGKGKHSIGWEKGGGGGFTTSSTVSY